MRPRRESPEVRLESPSFEGSIDVRQKSIRLVPFILALIAAVGCGGGEKSAAPAAAATPDSAQAPPATTTAVSLTGNAIKPPFGFLNRPNEGDSVKPGDWAFGWALADSGIAQITVAADTGATSPVALGQGFPGVAQAYPKYAGSDKAGFGFPIPKIDAGLHTIVVTLVGKDGGKTEIRRMVRVR
jgi:hypothetical protein